MTLPLSEVPLPCFPLISLRLSTGLEESCLVRLRLLLLIAWFAALSSVLVNSSFCLATPSSYPRACSFAVRTWRRGEPPSFGKVPSPPLPSCLVKAIRELLPLPVHILQLHPVDFEARPSLLNPHMNTTTMTTLPMSRLTTDQLGMRGAQITCNVLWNQ